MHGYSNHRFLRKAYIACFCISLIFIFHHKTQAQKTSEEKSQKTAIEQKTAIPTIKKNPSPKKTPSGTAEPQKSSAKQSPGAPAKDDKSAAQAHKEAEKKKKAEEREKKRVEWIEKTLEFGIQQDRMDAMGAILKIHDPVARNRLCNKLRESLKDEIDIEIKTKAISVLGELKFKEALPEILRMIDDETQDVKIAAVYAAKRIGDHSAKGRLSEEIKKQDLKKQSNYSEALIDALGEFKAIELKEFAIDAIKKDTTDKNIRQNLIVFLGRVEATDSRDFLLGIAKDDSEEMIARAYAVNSLARMKITDTAPEIDKIIKEIDSYPFKKRQRYYKLYVYSIAALARMGDQKVFPRLENAARSNNEQVRLQAVKLLKEIKGKRTIDILQYRMKYDPSSRVQRVAREALEELGVPIEESKDKAKTEDFLDDKEKSSGVHQRKEKESKKKDRTEDRTEDKEDEE